MGRLPSNLTSCKVLLSLYNFQRFSPSLRRKIHTGGALTNFFSSQRWIPLENLRNFAGFVYVMDSRVRCRGDSPLPLTRSRTLIKDGKSVDADYHMVNSSFQQANAMQIMAKKANFGGELVSGNNKNTTVFRSAPHVLSLCEQKWFSLLSRDVHFYPLSLLRSMLSGFNTFPFARGHVSSAHDAQRQVDVVDEDESDFRVFERVPSRKIHAKATVDFDDIAVMINEELGRGKDFQVKVRALVHHLKVKLSGSLMAQVLKLQRNPTVALSFFRWAAREGYPQSAYCYKILIHKLNPAKRDERHLEDVEASLSLLLEMMETDTNPAISTCNAVVGGLCGLDRLDSACGLVQIMKEKRWVPNLRTFNILLAGLVNARRWREAWELFDELKQANWKPDVVNGSRWLYPKPRHVQLQHQLARGERSM